MSTRYGRNVIMITSFDDSGKKKKSFIAFAPTGKVPFVYSPHTDEAYGSIQWKMTH